MATLFSYSTGTQAQALPGDRIPGIIGVLRAIVISVAISERLPGLPRPLLLGIGKRSATAACRSGRVSLSCLRMVFSVLPVNSAAAEMLTASSSVITVTLQEIW